MEDEDVISRLRALGGKPVDAAAAAGHLDRALAAVSARSRRWPVAVIAGVAAVTVATGIVTAAVGGGRPQTIGVGAPPDPVPPAGELGCDGPPPFVGQPPASDLDIDRAAEAAELVQWRAENCPADTEPPATSEPVDDPCTGPPPFASVPAEPADLATSTIPLPRAGEAAELAAQREACNDATPATSDPPAAAPAALPGVAQAEPPVELPAGPPESIPAGSPADAGQPESVPAGSPADAGKPDDTPASSPEIPLVGPPDISPGGPPGDRPGGPPENVPADPPENVPAGPPPGRGGGRG